MRKFSLRNPDFEIPSSGGLIFRWAGLDMEIANQLAFEEQYLRFHKHLLENLQSVPSESPDFNPSPLSLSIRAGAIKSYIIFATSLLEGALAALGERRGFAREPGSLYKKTFGGLLTIWKDGEIPKHEVAPIWAQLQLLKEYRNFIHLGNAAANEKAYWQQILDRENELLVAVDVSIEHMVTQCNGLYESN